MKFYFFGSILVAAVLTGVSRKNLGSKVLLSLIECVDKCYITPPSHEEILEEEKQYSS